MNNWLKNSDLPAPTELINDENGKIAYLVLWVMGAPLSLLFVLWFIFGNNLFGPG